MLCCCLPEEVQRVVLLFTWRSTKGCVVVHLKKYKGLCCCSPEEAQRACVVVCLMKPFRQGKNACNAWNAIYEGRKGSVSIATTNLLSQCYTKHSLSLLWTYPTHTDSQLSTLSHWMKLHPHNQFSGVDGNLGYDSYSQVEYMWDRYTQLLHWI